MQERKRVRKSIKRKEIALTRVAISRLAIFGTHPAVFVRVANKGDKSRQRTGIAVRPDRMIADVREG